MFLSLILVIAIPRILGEIVYDIYEFPNNISIYETIDTLGNTRVNQLIDNMVKYSEDYIYRHELIHRVIPFNSLNNGFYANYRQNGVVLFPELVHSLYITKSKFNKMQTCHYDFINGDELHLKKTSYHAFEFDLPIRNHMKFNLTDCLDALEHPLFMRAVLYHKPNDFVKIPFNQLQIFYDFLRRYHNGEKFEYLK